MTLHNRIIVPKRLGDVTTIGQECAPEDAGVSRREVALLWARIEAQYRSGLHPAICVALRRHGRLVLNRSIGHARGNSPGNARPVKVLANPDTPVCLFSGSKAITAILVHKLAETGAIHLDRPIAGYLPEFAANGKAGITVRQMLAHQGGMPALPAREPWADAIYDFDAMVRALSAAPAPRPGRCPSYHALSGGYVLGEVLRRVTGRELPELLREWLAEPLGCRHLTFGLPAAQRMQAAENAFTGPSRWTPVHSVMNRMLQAPLDQACAGSNQARWLSAVIPAANIYATADETCRVYQMLLDGGAWQGRRILREETVHELVRPFSGMRFDRTLMLPLRWSSGLMLGSRFPNFFGIRNAQAYGHLGLVSCLSWADPARDIAVTILTTGKPFLPSGLRQQFATAMAINSVCAPTRRSA
jgi:CubicO group peptidase (beta-lactamase class C family)